MDTQTILNARRAVNNLLQGTTEAKLTLKDHGTMAASAEQLHTLLNELEKPATNAPAEETKP